MNSQHSLWEQKRMLTNQLSTLEEKVQLLDKKEYYFHKPYHIPLSYVEEKKYEMQMETQIREKYEVVKQKLKKVEKELQNH